LHDWYIRRRWNPASIASHAANVLAKRPSEAEGLGSHEDIAEEIFSRDEG